MNAQLGFLLPLRDVTHAAEQKLTVLYNKRQAHRHIGVMVLMLLCNWIILWSVTFSSPYMSTDIHELTF